MANTTNLTIYRKKTRQEENILLDTSGIDTGIPFIDTVDDSLDSLVISLRNYPTRKPFEPFDLITYTIEDENGRDSTQMFVLFDHVSYYSGFNGKAAYTHKISCVETTKYLEKIKIFNLNLTNKNDTLYDQFVKALANAEPTITPSYYPKGNRFVMSQSLIDFLQGKASRDFYLANTDLRSALDEMLQAENARIYVEEIIPAHYTYTVLLGYQSYNIIQDVTPIWEKDKHGVIVSEEMQNDGQNYAGHIVSQGKNTIVEEPISFRDTFKSENAVISDKTAMVILPFPVSDKGFKSFNFIIKATYLHYRVGSTSAEGSILKSYDVPIDISNWLILEEDYELLPIKEAEKYIPYKKNSNRINFGKIYTSQFGLQYLSINDILIREEERQLFGTTMPGFEENGIKYDIGKFETRVSAVGNYENQIFECVYYPIVETIVNMDKSDVYDQNELLLGIRDNQTENILNPDLHGKKLAGLINRTGNPNYIASVKADKFSSLLPVMSRITLPDAEDEEDNNYVLYRREYAVYDNYIDCKYYFSKNYNKVQNAAGVNREKQIYSIPLEDDETPIVIKKYLLFSYDEIEKKDDCFVPIFVKSALNTLFQKNISIEPNIESFGKVQYLILQTKAKIYDTEVFGYEYPQDTKNGDGETPYKDNPNARFILPIVSYSHNKVMTFCASPLDNYSINYSRDGYKFDLWGAVGHKITYNEYVSKDNKIAGQCDKFYLQYAFDFIGEKNLIKKFPIVENPSDSLSFATNNDIVLWYNKDRTQKHVFALSLECKTDKSHKNNLIVGSQFAKMNNLLRNNQNWAETLKVYVSTNYKFAGDEDILPLNYTSKEYEVGSIFFLVTTTTGACLQLFYGTIDFENVKSWAIADGSGRIYLAGNGIPRNIYCAVADWC